MRHIGPVAAVALVLLLASLNYLAGIGEPRRVVWDESYYVTSTQRYEEGSAQFASHPPLGLMLIAAGDALLRVNRGIDTTVLGREKKISGEQLPEQFSFVGERATSGAFAVAGAAAFFALMLALTRSVIAAALLANLYIFENAFIVQFRAAQLDSFEVFFTICALLCFVALIRRGARGSLALDFALGAVCGLAMMVKLNAAVVTVLGVMVVLHRAGLGRSGRSRGKRFALAARDGGVMLGGGVLAVVAVFSLHVALGRHPPNTQSPAGLQDSRFISATYRDYLEGSRPLSPAVVLAAADDYARFMSADFAGMTRVDSNASGALQWPLHRKTINYRWDFRGGVTRYVQLTGNLFDWMLALVAPIAATGLLILRKLRPCAATDPDRRALMTMLLLEYAVFMAAHVWLGTQRVTYFYHYFIGLLLAFCLVPLVWMEAADRWQRLRTRLEPVMAGATALLLASFIFYAPLTFHRPLSHAECERRNLFQHVVDCHS